MSGPQSRPGADTRVWFAMAVVTELGYDPVAVPGVSGGVFADVKLLPGGEPDTCYVGMPYAGAEFGAWYPLNVGDHVLVAYPYGESGWGPVIVSRIWNSAALPPTPSDPDWARGLQTNEPPTDVIIRVQRGRSYRLRADTGDVDVTVDTSGAINISNRGTGDVNVEALGAGKVKLGVAETAQPIALSPLVEAAIKAAVEAAIAGHVHMVTIPTLSTPTPSLIGIKAAPAVPYIATVSSTAATKTEAT